jgi:hypothetical protein
MASTHRSFSSPHARRVSASSQTTPNPKTPRQGVTIAPTRRNTQLQPRNLESLCATSRGRKRLPVLHCPGVFGAGLSHPVILLLNAADVTNTT